MFNLYKLEIDKKLNKSNLETIYDYLDLYNGHPGYTLLAEVKTEQEFNYFVIDFIEKWELGKNNILALVIEDMYGNVIDILYETENMELKWSEDNVPKNVVHNFFSENRKGTIYKNANGYYFYSKRGITYDLLEGVSIGSMKASDIVFIMLRSPNYEVEDLFVGYFFGAYSFADNPYFIEERIAELVEEYERKNFDKYK